MILSVLSLVIPEASVILTALGVIGAWLATWLARRGKREDYKIQVGNQALVELKALADSRKEEIDRKNTQIADLEAKVERVTKTWEDRWSRQMERCRKVTDAAAEEIACLMRRAINPRTRQHADATLRDIEDHTIADHGEEDEDA